MILKKNIAKIIHFFGIYLLPCLNYTLKTMFRGRNRPPPYVRSGAQIWGGGLEVYLIPPRAFLGMNKFKLHFYYDIKTHRRVEVYLHSFLTTELRLR
jgi:hypothetical protein